MDLLFFMDPADASRRMRVNVGLFFWVRIRPQQLGNLEFSYILTMLLL